MESRFHARIITLAAMLSVSVMPLHSAPVHGQDQTDPQVASVAPPLEPTLIRLYARDRDHLNAVAGELDIWEAHPDESYVVAMVTPAQYAWLEGLGYRVEQEDIGTAAEATRAPLDPRYYYFDDYRTNWNDRYVVDFLQDTQEAYPDLTALYDIGDAWMADQPGEYDRDIWVLRITNEDSSFGPIEDKPAFFLFAAMHAREISVPELAIRYIKYLTGGYDGEGSYGVDPDVTWLVDHHVIHVLVMQNPDGHWNVEGYPLSNRRKNMDWDDGCDYATKWGVDLNRNHSFLWNCCGGSSGDPCVETYRGPSRASEPETQAFESYFASVMLDQNGPNGDDEIPPAAPDDTTGIFISLHSYYDEVLWPWGFTMFGDAPNHAQLETIGRKFAYFNGYEPGGTLWYDTEGTTDDWTYGKFGIASFTFEVGARLGDTCGGFLAAYGCIDGIDDMPRSFWSENRPAFLYAHKIARTPYITSYGPDTLNVSVSLDEVPMGTSADLTATIADHRYGDDPTQRTAAAEYFIDAPGEDGSGIPMSPSDGGWGGLSEEVNASVDSTGLTVGRHYILVHGRNYNGIWGTYTAVFMNVACLRGDFDCDGSVNPDDHAVFASCLTGPAESTEPSGCSADEFLRSDLDDDSDVDMVDFAAFQAILGQ